MSVDDSGEPGRWETVRQLREWAQHVLNYVSIHDVRTARLEATSSTALLDGPFEVTSQLSFMGRQPGPSRVETASQYEVRCTGNSDSDSDDQEAWMIRVELVANFPANGDGDLPVFSADCLNAFAMIVGLMHLHPYAREVIQSTSGRLGYPPFTLDRLDPVAGGNDDQMVFFGES